MNRNLVRLMGAFVMAGVVAVASCSGDEGATGPNGAVGPTGPTGPAGPTGPVEVEVFRTTLAGQNEVPAVNSTGSGTATVTLVGGILSFRVDVANIQNVTLA